MILVWDPCDCYEIAAGCCRLLWDSDFWDNTYECYAACLRCFNKYFQSGCCGIAGGMMWDSCGMLLEFPVVLLGITVILLWHDCGIPVIAGWIACCGIALVLL